MTHFLLFYDYVENVVERRAPHREAHLALLGEYVDRGEVVLGGAFANPTDGAAIVFAVDSSGEESPVVSCLTPPPPK